MFSARPPDSLPRFGYAADPPSSDGRRTRTFRAVDQIRRAITLYAFVPLFSALLAVFVTAVTLATNSYALGNFDGTSFGGVVASDSTVVTLLSGLTGLLLLVLTIVAWLTWRGGVREMRETAGEYGAHQVAAARSAERDYGRTVYTYIGILVFGVAVSVVLAVALFAAIAGDVTSGQSGTSLISSAIAGLLVALLVVALIGVVLSVLLYDFATRSLVGALAAIAPPATLRRLRQARSIILIGAVLQILGAVVFVNGGLYALSIVSPAVLFVGFCWLRSGYSAWMQSPPAPTGGAPTPFLTVGSFSPGGPPR